MAAMAGALVCLALSGCAGMLADLFAASAEQRVVEGLRASLQDALSKMPPAHIRTKPAGALVAGLQRYPNALASLAISHSAAKSMLGIGPLLAAAAVALVSWEAALTLVLAIPVMVVFFATLGGVIRGQSRGAREGLRPAGGAVLRSDPDLADHPGQSRLAGRTRQDRTADDPLCRQHDGCSQSCVPQRRHHRFFLRTSDRRARDILRPRPSRARAYPRIFRPGPLAEPVHSHHRSRVLCTVPALCRAVSRQGRR